MLNTINCNVDRHEYYCNDVEHPEYYCNDVEHPEYYCNDVEHPEYYCNDVEHPEYYCNDVEHPEYYCYDVEHPEYYCNDVEHHALCCTSYQGYQCLPSIFCKTINKDCFCEYCSILFIDHILNMGVMLYFKWVVSSITPDIELFSKFHNISIYKVL